MYGIAADECHLTKPRLAGVLLLALVANAAFGAILGFRDGADTSVYVPHARFLLDQGYLSPGGNRHVGYIVYLALCLKVFGTTRASVLLQTAFNALALTLLYGEWRLWAKPKALWMDGIAVVAIAVNPFVLFWNWYVLAESVYTSLLACLFVSLLQWMRTGRAMPLMAGGLLTFLAWVTRSNAIGLPFAVAVGLSWHAWRERHLKKTVAVVGIAAAVLFCVAAQRLLQPTLATDLMKPAILLSRGVVIWDYDATNLPMPSGYQMHDGGWSDFAGYVREHPVASARVFASRVIIEAIRYRPFWSLRQNVVSTAMMVTAWLLVAVAFLRDPDWLVRLGGILVAYHFALAALVLSDWDGRLLGHVLPIVMAMACSGLVSLRRSGPRGVPLESQPRSPSVRPD